MKLIIITKDTFFPEEASWINGKRLRDSLSHL